MTNKPFTRCTFVRFFLIGAGALSSYVLAEEANRESWYPWNPNTDYSEDSRLHLGDWLEAPAGKHGFVQITDTGSFAFEDGTPVKFWGTNTSNLKVAPDAATAIATAEMLQMYGMNGLRLHKWTWGVEDRYGKGITSLDSVLEFDEALLDQMDFFMLQLRERGIYYGWSHIYGTRPKLGDAGRLLNYEEIAGIEVPWQHLSHSTSFLVNFAPDLQDLNIELTTRLLNHVNPHTGLRYADDTALSFIELQNEDDIFWGAHERALDQTPTYRALLCQRFSDWLLELYGNEASWRAAWGEDAMLEGESISQGTVYPKPNHEWINTMFSDAAAEGRAPPRHVLDKVRYLYEEQLAYYRKFAKAIRETGYRGPIVGSCWQAGKGIAHFYNLHSDADVGIVDRHNYFGSGTGWRESEDGSIERVSQLLEAGSGILSTGMQQVLSRPFALSEWIVTNPNAWGAEGTPLIAAYGMGLQGWDASYSFAFDSHGWPDTRGRRWNVRSPMHLGLYPIISRMVHRGEIKEGGLVALRNVHVPSLIDGILGFEDAIEQEFDFKEFRGFVPNEALAVGKVGVRFTDTQETSWVEDLDSYIDNGIIHSNTNQLTWKTFESGGRILINGDSTIGSIGFSNGTADTFSFATIEFDNEFAVVLVGTLGKTETISNAERLLVTTMARVVNTGTVYSEDRTKLIESGQAPLLIEPIVATIYFENRDAGSVIVLDHMGRPTGESFPFEKGEVHFNGAKWKTPYYEIVFE